MGMSSQDLPQATEENFEKKSLSLVIAFRVGYSNWVPPKYKLTGDGVIGIETGYSVDDPGIESR